MSKTPFRHSRSRIRWAKEDIAHFHKSACAFFGGNPYIRTVEMDDDGIYELHKLKLAKPFPDAFVHRAIKTIEGLRSALDLTAYAVADKSGPGAADAVHFPFCKTAADMKSRINGTCKNLPDEIKALFASFKPYKGGDDLLWALNELCNASKHRLIVPVGLSAGTMLRRATMASGSVGGYIPIPRWDSGKEEIVFGATSPGAKFDYDIEMLFGITFGDVEIVKGQPVEVVLHRLLGKVSGIVDVTEAECRRIGLIS
jgi:hypothetical protein